MKNIRRIDDVFSLIFNNRLLVHSLCPSIYGHELVKAALLMALFGGLVRDEDGIVSEMNYYIHISLVLSCLVSYSNSF